ncbi:hypothetical protein ACF0H5_005864 [Mactra antiquata]
MNGSTLILGTVLYSIVVLAVVGIENSYSETWPEDECRRMLREATDVSVKAPKPPKLSGHWTSSECEVRPGPEFVMRKYLFRRNSFQAQVYYYADEHCNEATHYILAKGSVKPSRPSWLTPGGYETRHSVTEISIIPYNEETSKRFGKLMRRYCRQSRIEEIVPYKKFRVLKFTKYSKNDYDNDVIEDDFDCSKLFNFTMNELQLVRVEKRRTKNSRQSDQSSRGRARMELLLGDVSTNMKYRRQYVPTHYQTPLLKSKTSGCSVCRTIANASSTQPPILRIHRRGEVGLAGEWVSRACETRPNGEYLTRHLSFLKDGKSWQGTYEFHRDPLCLDPSFTIWVKGNYFIEEKSDIINSAFNYVFKTTRLKIMPQDFQTVSYLNSYSGDGCGEPGAWKIGETRDVTGTGGCYTLGITLPNVEYELIRTEVTDQQILLHVGQRPSDHVSLSTPKYRPTSFQRPLVRCGTIKKEKEILSEKEKSKYEMPVYHHQYSNLPSNINELKASTGCKISQNLLLLLLVFVIVYKVVN